VRKKALILILLLIVGVSFLFAGTTGKLAGKVKDESGKGIAYVNVMVFQNGRRITGQLTKENGTYMIINIPPGEYEVRFQLQGYALVIVPNVRIYVDQTTTQNATMTKKSIVLDKVVVTATSKGPAKDEVSTTRKIDTQNIANMAVSDVQDIVALQAGAIVVGGELHVRGGRANEVNYTIDNMSVSDPVDGGTALQVDPDAISDMKVMTGGFTAEYGNAQSGVVNIITKEGDPFYSGKLEYSTDRYIGQSRNEDAVKFAIGGPVVPFSNDDLRKDFTFYLNGGGNWQDGRLRKYAKGNPYKDFVWKGRRILSNEYPDVNPFEERKYEYGTRENPTTFLEKLLGMQFADRFYNSYNVNFKTKYQISELQKVTFAARADRSTNDLFNYLWRYAPDYNGEDETIQQQYVGSYDWVLNPAMNLKVKASYFQKNYTLGPKGIDRHGYFFYNDDLKNLYANYSDSLWNAYKPTYVENVLDGNYGYNSIGIDRNGDGSYIYYTGFLSETDWTYLVEGEPDPYPIQGFVPPGTIYENFIDDQTSTINARADFEWQFNDIHQFKSGLELIHHNIKKNQIFNFLKVDEPRRIAYLNQIYNMNNYVNYDSLSGGIYVPEQLVDVVIPSDGAPIGIYYPEDYLKAAYAASGDRDGYKAQPWQAAYYLQDKMEWEGMIVNAGLRFDFWYLGKDYQVLLDNGSYMTAPRYEYKIRNEQGFVVDTLVVVGFDKKDRFQMMVSPRLGVSHPISDKDVLRFAYNYQNQLPQMQFIFTSKTPSDANLSETTVVVGNPTLEPQITITYEVGLTHQISEDYSLDMTAYYKNLYNYVSTRKITENNVTYYEYISEDYGSARGIDLQVEKSLSDFNAWSIAYSLGWATGNNSETVIQDEQTSLREFPLDWDVRHTINLNYNFRIARGEEFIVPFTNFILPFDDFSANFTWTYASGTPYTPTTGTQNTPLDTNSKRKKATQQANLRLTKGFNFPFGNFRVYMDVENLFKYMNISSVFPRTGSPYDDGVDLGEGEYNYTYEEVQYMHNKAVINPANFNNFRAVTLGVSFNF